jgi:LPXTG-site transpeptidase (sortase) family protein
VMEQATSRRSAGWNRLSFIVMGAGVASLLAAAVLLILNLTGVMGNGGYGGPGTSTAFGSGVERYLTPQPTPTAALAPPSEAPIARILIPRFGVDASVVVRGVDTNGVMETPDGPEDVAWYDFSARTGFGSNAVFSGHVDYINYGPAVFWNLKDLEPGDIVEVRLEDGTNYRYSVTDREMVPANPPQEKLAQILGPTQQEIITLITCGGTFDPSVGQYDQRVIVRAERIYESAAPTQIVP